MPILLKVIKPYSQKVHVAIFIFLSVYWYTMHLYQEKCMILILYISVILISTPQFTSIALISHLYFRSLCANELHDSIENLFRGAFRILLSHTIGFKDLFKCYLTNNISLDSTIRNDCNVQIWEFFSLFNFKLTLPILIANNLIHKIT